MYNIYIYIRMSLLFLVEHIFVVSLYMHISNKHVLIQNAYDVYLHYILLIVEHYLMYIYITYY